MTGRYSILGWDPWLVLRAQGPDITLTERGITRPVAGSPLDALRQVVRRFRVAPSAQLPPAGFGLFGLFGYELNQWIERLPAPKPVTPRTPDLLVLGLRSIVVVDHARDETWLVSMGASDEAVEGLARLQALIDDEPAADPGLGCGEANPTMSQDAFERIVAEARESILAGEIFQANLSQQFVGRWSGSPWPLARALRRINPSPFASLIVTPEHTVVSCSPERLVDRRGGRLSTRPIAGTRRRGEAPEEDLLQSLELILSDKERAEHVMLVDLERNDLGRVCRFGSVTVDELLVLEEYSHVVHLVSNVSGLPRRDVGVVDVLRAVFPGGTITGCPKVRAMEIIHQLEPVGRGLYTGSCGWLGFDGSLDLNILIRTMILQDGRLSFHVGAGIVADSRPDREYHETLAKGEALMRAIEQASGSAVLEGGRCL